jgi:hypothetical protein
MFDYKLLLCKKLPFPMPARQAVLSLGLHKLAAVKPEKPLLQRFLDVSMRERDLLPFLCKTPCKAI